MPIARIVRAADWPDELHHACDRMEEAGDRLVDARAADSQGEALTEFVAARQEYGRQMLALDRVRRPEACADAEPGPQPPEWQGMPIRVGWWILDFPDGAGPRYWDGTFWKLGSFFAGPEDYAAFPILGPLTMPGDVDRLGKMLAEVIDAPLLTVRSPDGPRDIELRVGSFRGDLSEQAAALLEEFGY